jgi:hypothetical protein
LKRARSSWFKAASLTDQSGLNKAISLAQDRKPRDKALRKRSLTKVREVIRYPPSGKAAAHN